MRYFWALKRVHIRQSALGIASVVAAVSLMPVQNVHSADNFITVGTGAMVGVYYPVGQAICRFVNAGRKEHGHRCAVKSTAGSVSNANAVLAGELTIGLAQGEVQFYALNGVEMFKEKQPKLRAMFALYPEVFTLVARQDANIRSFTDLKGKRLSVGEVGSGTRMALARALPATGLSREDLGAGPELKPMEMAPALCDNKIDAFVYVAGHPNAIFHEAANSCASRVVGVDGPGIDRLVRENPYYVKANVPGGLYKGTSDPQPSFAMLATVVASVDLPEQTAYVITKAVFDNLEEFKTLHPALAKVTREKMLEGNVAPFHPGALKYFKEKGLQP
jgi:TRAP transporter TAXI family solute receptor